MWWSPEFANFTCVVSFNLAVHPHWMREQKINPIDIVRVLAIEFVLHPMPSKQRKSAARVWTASACTPWICFFMF
jgi:hypothetical protein